MIELRNPRAVFISQQRIDTSGDSVFIADDGTIGVGSEPTSASSHDTASPRAVGELSERRRGEGRAMEGREIIDVTGCVITPGLVNAHNHLMQTAFRTLPGTRGVPMRVWLRVMSEAYAGAGIDNSLTRAAGRVAAAEAVLSGVTTLADHQLNWPVGHDLDRAVAVARGSVEVTVGIGARAVFVRGTAGDDARFAAESAEALVEALGVISPGGTSRDGMVQLAVGPAGVHSDGEDTYRALGDVAVRYGLRRRTQANEQVDVDIAVERYGARPLELLDSWGWLAPDVTVAHLCSLSAAEVDLVSERGITATHAPGCDLPMGWGLTPVRNLLENGVVVGLGTSGAGSNDAGHLLSDARLAMQVSGLLGPALSAEQVIGMATSGSAVGMGRPELGELTLGSPADLCVWSMESVFDAGVHDPIAGLIWCGPGRRPRDVFVSGRAVVREGMLRTADEGALRADLEARVPIRG